MYNLILINNVIKSYFIEFIYIVISSQDYRYIYYTHIYLKTLFTNKCDLQVHDTPKTWSCEPKN